MTPREKFENLPQVKEILKCGAIYFCPVRKHYETTKSSLMMCVYFINGAWYSYQHIFSVMNKSED